MSAPDLHPVTGRSPLAWSALDGWVLCKRNLIKTIRAPQLVVAATVQPVVLVLLFSFVFAGAIDVGPGLDYVDFVMPGIFVQTAVFAATATGIGLAEDRQRGAVTLLAHSSASREGYREKRGHNCALRTSGRCRAAHPPQAMGWRGSGV